MSEIRLILTILGIVMVAGMLFDRPLYALNLRLYRKYGWSSLANTWERRQAWWLPGCLDENSCIISFLVVTYNCPEAGKKGAMRSCKDGWHKRETEFHV